MFAKVSPIYTVHLSSLRLCSKQEQFLKRMAQLQEYNIFTDDSYIFPYILANEKICQKYFILKNKNGS